MKEISERIKEIIKERGLTQAYIAQKMEITPQTFSDKLNKTHNFTISFLIDLDSIIKGLDFNYVFTGIKNTNKIVQRSESSEIIIESLIEKIKRLEGKHKDTETMPKAA